MVQVDCNLHPPECPNLPWLAGCLVWSSHNGRIPEVLRKHDHWRRRLRIRISCAHRMLLSNSNRSAKAACSSASGVRGGTKGVSVEASLEQSSQTAPLQNMTRKKPCAKRPSQLRKFHPKSPIPDHNLLPKIEQPENRLVLCLRQRGLSHCHTSGSSTSYQSII